MNSEIFFTERQRFTQWWFWLILLGVNGLFLFGVFTQIVRGEQFGDNPISDTGLLIVTGSMLLLTLLFVSSRLDTVIKKDGIYVRFFPFHVRFKHYTWDTLTKTSIREYSALTEYGGWGFRFGFFGKGAALNVSGDKGLQLEFVNHKRLLIGTNKPDQLTKVLNNIGRIKE